VAFVDNFFLLDKLFGGSKSRPIEKKKAKYKLKLFER